MHRRGYAPTCRNGGRTHNRLGYLNRLNYGQLAGSPLHWAEIVEKEPSSAVVVVA